MGLDEKITEAQQALKLAADISKTYYNKPLIICYSGGKDSDVLLDITKKCLKPDAFEVLNSHTTVDAPETVYHIRSVLKELKTQGVKATVKMPTYKGQRVSMWTLIEKKSMPPTRLSRYCCQVLKESTTPNRIIAVGVREDESQGRKGRDIFALRGQRKQDAKYRTLGHMFAMFQIDKRGGESAYQCEFITAAKKNKDMVTNPIYHFTESDIWEYIKTFNVRVNPLYAKGYKRVGCIGCPLAGPKQMAKEFQDYPAYKLNYIKAFDRMQKINEQKGIKNKCGLKTGVDWFRWWIGENPKQIKIEDILEEHTQEVKRT